ncbi:DNA replication/repair protein RecF [candidate division WWE3 bacterium]|nr:DNA replication/repair protein RecF [candidate division WWE3 bacterium]
MLTDLILENYRNISRITLNNFHPTTNVIIERNGFGKSNLLEAIYLLATGSSPRTSHMRELIQWQQPYARIEGSVSDFVLSVAVQLTRKTFFVNRKKVDFRRYFGHFSVVYFQPTDLYLLTGSPAIRRNFLDRLIGQYDIEYLADLITYQKLLHQRNALLRELSGNLDVLEVIEDRMSEKGAVIYSRRNAVIDRLNGLLSPYDVKINYLPSPRELRGNLAEINAENNSVNVRELLREKMRGLREKERLLKFTLTGNQRDDFSVFIADQSSPEGWKDAGIYGSRGQQRVAMMRLKMGERDILSESTGNSPILLLDDVFSELDESNRAVLSQEIAPYQTFITAAVNDHMIPEYFPNDSRIDLRELNVL